MGVTLDKTESVESGRAGVVGVTPVGWEPPANLSYEVWMTVGRRVATFARGAQWWVGDWVRVGALKYGGRYKEAVRLTGYDESTLQNIVWVAGRFEISRRRENLTWSHHAEVAALDVVEQERWLDQAERDGLSVRALRQALSRANAEPSAPGDEGAAANGSSGREPSCSASSVPEQGIGHASVARANAGRDVGMDPVAPEHSAEICPNCGFAL